MKKSLEQITAVLKGLAKDSFNPTETLQWVCANKLWCMTWGIKNITTFTGNAPKGYSKVLFFTVSGLKHKGIVAISLAYNDTYTIDLLTSNWEPVKTIDMIYCDQLAEIIDNEVERVKEYKY